MALYETALFGDHEASPTTRFINQQRSPATSIDQIKVELTQEYSDWEDQYDVTETESGDLDIETDLLHITFYEQNGSTRAYVRQADPNQSESAVYNQVREQPEERFWEDFIAIYFQD